VPGAYATAGSLLRWRKTRGASTGISLPCCVEDRFVGYEEVVALDDRVIDSASMYAAIARSAQQVP
jgi:hypothetical protein